jgi:hypothetical protein
MRWCRPNVSKVCVLPIVRGPTVSLVQERDVVDLHAGVDGELPVRGDAHLARVDTVHGAERELLELGPDPAQHVVRVEAASRCRQHEQHAVPFVRGERREPALLEPQRFERRAVGQAGQAPWSS